MKDKTGRGLTRAARQVAVDAEDYALRAHRRIDNIDRNATDAIRVLAREQQRLAAEVEADQVVEDLVDAAAAAVLTSHDERIATLEARVNALSEQLAAALPAEPYAPEQVTVEDVIEGAINDHEVVEFCYEDRDGIQSLRLVSPYDLTDARNGARLLVGYDHDRDGIRQFRVERITADSMLFDDGSVSYREPVSE